VKDNHIYFNSRGLEQMFRNGTIIGIIAAIHMPWVTGMSTDDNGRQKYGQVWDRYDHRWHNYRCHPAIPVQSFIMKDGSLMSSADMRDFMIRANALIKWSDNYVDDHEW